MATGSFKLPLSSGGAEEWVRPSDWLPMPNVTAADDTFVGLYAVFPEGQNFATVLCVTSTGQFRVDWGDGTVTLHNSNTVAQYEYNYASISNSTLTTRGYKQAMITVTAVSGLLRSIDLQRRFTTSPTQNQSYATGFLDCILSMPNAITNGITLGGVGLRHAYCERFDIKTIGSVTTLLSCFSGFRTLQSVPLFNTANASNMQNMFAGCTSLKTVPLFNTASVTTMQNMFDTCRSLQSVPLFNTQNVTSMANMFINCSALLTVPLFNTISVTRMDQMFSGCLSLRTIPLFNTANVTNMGAMLATCTSLQSLPNFNTQNVTSMNLMLQNCNILKEIPLLNTINVTSMQNMFQQCQSLQSVPLLNTSNVTNMNGLFSGCPSLNSIPAFSTAAITTTSGSDFGNIGESCSSLDRCEMIFSRSVAFQNAQLSRTALIEVFTNLVNRSATTSATINITGNWGASALTAGERAIATGKNWVIVG